MQRKSQVDNILVRRWPQLESTGIAMNHVSASTEDWILSISAQKAVNNTGTKVKQTQDSLSDGGKTPRIIESGQLQTWGG